MEKNYAGDMIINLYLKDVWRIQNQFNTRCVFPSDRNRVLTFVETNFPKEKGWLMEVDHAMHEGKCYISVLEQEIVGFACFDCSGKGYFGPFGVAKQQRGKGIGTELLYACLDGMKFCGYGYGIIGWVDESAKGFYEKAAKATYIPYSEPHHTLYKRRILTTNETGYPILWDELDLHKKWGDDVKNQNI